MADFSGAEVGKFDTTVSPSLSSSTLPINFGRSPEALIYTHTVYEHTVVYAQKEAFSYLAFRLAR
jgi:hypothetical protein